MFSICLNLSNGEKLIQMGLERQKLGIYCHFEEETRKSGMNKRVGNKSQFMARHNENTSAQISPAGSFRLFDAERSADARICSVR